VESVTASGNGTVTLSQQSGQQSAFAVFASNNTLNNSNGQIVVNLGALPLTAQICQTASTGQCIAAPASTIPDSFTAGQSETFSIFLQSEGLAINGGTVTVNFEDGNGATLGQTSVIVQTN